jgi:hypothetical protein
MSDATTTTTSGLGALLQSTQPDALATCSVDLNEFFDGQPAVFTFQEPDVPRLAAVQEDAKRLRRAYPQMPKGGCMEVALLALTFTGDPSPLTAGDLFMRLALAKPRAYLRLRQAWSEAFPFLAGDETVLDERVNS